MKSGHNLLGPVPFSTENINLNLRVGKKSFFDEILEIGVFNTMLFRGTRACPEVGRPRFEFCLFFFGKKEQNILRESGDTSK